MLGERQAGTKTRWNRIRGVIGGTMDGLRMDGGQSLFT